MDRNRGYREKLERRIAEGEGETPVANRRALVASQPLVASPEVAAFAAQVQAAAYKISDQEVADLSARIGDEQLFEYTIAAAVGKAKAQRSAVATLLDDVYSAAEAAPKESR